MTTIKVIGEAYEATIRQTKDGYTFDCSQGMWCTRPDDIRVEDTMADVIEIAETHISQHDDE